MRLLAVRGRNLASLARFEIDFRRPPLAGAGLIAVSGPTGAGKSTILDAIALALFGEMPRLDAAGRQRDAPDASGDGLAADDPRAILRRGAGEASAEVDFIGRDGVVRRARWLARRAREKAAGKLQAVERAVEALDAIGTPTSTLVAGVSLVQPHLDLATGLDFGQFRRTTLLAQGDFAAFLNARADERGLLLERITGTAVYSRLSQRVFEMAREAREAARRLEEDRAHLGLMRPEDREALVAEQATLTARVTERREAGRAIAEALALHRAADEAAAREIEARGVAEAAEAAVMEAGSDRERLALLDRAEALRPVWREARMAETAAEQAVERLKLAEARLTEADTARAGAAETAAARLGERERVAATVRALEPVWREAEALDLRIDLATRHVEETGQTLALAEGAAGATAAEASRLAVERDGVTAELDTLSTSLDGRAELVTAADWLPRALQDWQTARQTLRDGRQALADTEETIRRHETTLADLAGRREQAHGKLEGALKRVARDEAALAMIDRDVVAARLPLLDAVETALSRRHESMAAVGLAGQRLARAEAAVAAASRALADARADHAGADETRRGAAAKVDRLAPAAELASLVEDAAAHALRARLNDGEPCPVCGGMDHPFRHDRALAERSAAIRVGFADARRALAVSEAALNAAATALATAEGRAAAARDEVLAAGHDLDRMRPLAEAAEAAFVLAVGAAGLIVSDGLPRDVRSERERLAGALRRATDLDKALAEARTTAEMARRDEATLAREEADERTSIAGARTEAATRREQVRGGEAALERDDSRLVVPLALCGVTIADAAASPVASRERLRRALDDLGRDRRRRDALATLEPSLQREVTIAEEKARAAGAAVPGARQADERARAALSGLRVERAALLGGDATEHHRARHRAALAAAEAAEAAARAALGRESESASGVRASRDGIVDETARLATAARAAHAAFTAAAMAANLAPDAALSLLERPAGERDDLAARIAHLDRTLADAQARLVARAADRVAADLARPVEAADLLGETRDRLDHEADASNRQIGEIATKLAADDVARATAGALEAALAQARAREAEVGAVNEAIGSASGARFREFAQAHTLDRLVRLANETLADLSPRFSLTRGEGSDLALHVIDRDMGDALRATQSLSGGERFLVSLALALGLSRLETRGALADTLFIDEGFGTLDQATLDTAIDALERLQAEGRRVVVISHVAALTERIGTRIQVVPTGGGASRVEIG